MAMPPQFAKKAKAKGVTPKQAGLVAKAMGAKPAAAPMDAEDMLDGGVDENKERS